MTERLVDALFASDDINFFAKESGNATFSSEEMGILSVDFNNIDLHVNFDEDFP